MPELAAKSENEYLTDRLNSEAVDFIRRNKDKRIFPVSLPLLGAYTN